MTTSNFRGSNSRKMETAHHIVLVSESDKARYLLGADDDCIEDIESGGFDDGGILKLSRPVATAATW
jgi:hypothetical protein